MTNRLFIAFDLPEKTINDLIELRNSIYQSDDNIKWEGEDKLHITIKFLGDVGENITELLVDRLDDMIFSPFEAQFNNFSFFNRDNQRKILYTDFIQNEAFTEIFSQIDDECSLLGFHKEKRRYFPHLTLLRIKGRENQQELNKFYNKEIDLEKFKISSFSLIKSELLPTGSEYKVLKKFKFI